jgi:hypothetical protein
MSKGVQIELDKASLNHLNKQFKALDTTIEKAGPKAIWKVLYKIKTEAQLRLKGRKHIKTSRLRNSIYVQMKNSKPTPDNAKTYSDNEGKSYSSELRTVRLKDEFEGAVGTNVEYAGAIEFGARPHTITAKNAKVLSDGKNFFGKKVNHPGFGGDSFLYWALKNVDVTKNVRDDIRNEMKFKL